MDLEQKAIERLKMAAETSIAYYEQPLVITYSGGKDSDIILDLALKAKIPIEVVHSHTTADAPQTVRYVRQKLYDLELRGVPVSITYPVYKGKRESLWSLIRKKGAPTRSIRWCCAICKEQTCINRVIATGVRWAESTQRKLRAPIESIGRTKKDKILIFDDDQENEQMILSDMVIINNDNDDHRRWIEQCQLQGKICYNPIIKWTDRNVWDYLAGKKSIHCTVWDLIVQGVLVARNQGIKDILNLVFFHLLKLCG